MVNLLSIFYTNQILTTLIAHVLPRLLAHKLATTCPLKIIIFKITVLYKYSNFSSHP